LVEVAVTTSGYVVVASLVLGATRSPQLVVVTAKRRTTSAPKMRLLFLRPQIVNARIHPNIGPLAIWPPEAFLTGVVIERLVTAVAAPGTTLVGAKAAAAPAGKPLTLKSTKPVKGAGWA
jgi:hypothetical protein